MMPRYQDVLSEIKTVEGKVDKKIPRTEKRREYERKYYKLNRDKLRANQRRYEATPERKRKEREYYKKNIQRIREYNKQYRLKNKDRVDGYGRKWKLKTPDYNRLFYIRTKSDRQKRVLNNRIQVIKYYSNGKFCCACCNESLFKLLTVDHINGRKNSDQDFNYTGDRLNFWLIKNNFPSGYQILCYNCNCGRSANAGKCPHQEILEKFKKNE